MRTLVSCLIPTLLLGSAGPGCVDDDGVDDEDFVDGMTEGQAHTVSFKHFVPDGITPIIPGLPLPTTIRMTGAIGSGRTVALEFPLLDPTAPIELEVHRNGTLIDARLLARSEARKLLDVLSDQFIELPEAMGVYIPMLDRLALMPEVLPPETYNSGRGNVTARKAEAASLGLSQHRFDRDGLGYAYVEGGDPAGETVLILPGYPDGWTTWRAQIPTLIDAGYHVIAVDLPGCGDSGGAVGIERFNHRAITADISALLDALAIEQPNVVGHDWGALVAWDLAALHPAQVDKLAVFTVGHPAVYSTPNPPVIDAEAFGKLWYHNLFANSYSGVAEYLMKKHRWQLFEYLTGDHPETGYWKRDLSRPGALRAARSMFVANSNNFMTPDFQTIPAVLAPTLGLISDGDLRYVGLQQMEQSELLVTSGRFRSEMIENAGHWSMADQPAVVNQLLLDFLGE